jgi:recombinational DNA repair protein (RecF pathway)
MAGEIIKTDGIVLAIHPWSRTSHIVTWLTPDHGCVTTLVKGAVRPKSAFLGQYDLFYTCDLLYYARARGDMHALRETTPRNLRESLRGRWRETAIAGYAAGLVKDLAPANGESAAWFEFMSSLLDRLETHSLIPLLELVRLEMDILRLAGWSPDFSGMDKSADWTPFAIDHGRCGDGTRTVRLSSRTVAVLVRPDASGHAQETVEDAVRFLGVFLSYHLDAPPDVRRSLVTLLTSP